MKYQVTGNEYLSLPTIRETDGAIEGVTFLYMRLKGMLEVRGDDALIRPGLVLDGERIALHPVWRREHYWIPSFSSKEEGIEYQCVYLAPVGQRAFGLRLTAKNTGERARSVRVDVSGRWDRTLHEINETAELPDGREVKESGWNHMFIWSQSFGEPLFAMAPCIGDSQPFSEIDQGAGWSYDGFSYDIWKETRLAPGEEVRLDVFFGIGYEGVAAATSAKELLRQGFDALLSGETDWLIAREKHLADQKMETILNENLFFACFFASGRCVDTEEVCLMTSRSPRYYVSAAYWDRDALLWAFPAILTVDHAYARELLLWVFSRQARNFGIHSRYIDGTVLEPGFELDELCAPVVALNRYVIKTNDREILEEPGVRQGLNEIVKRLEDKCDPRSGLYETFLQPTDDLRRYPFLTYDNVLVWHSLHALSALLGKKELEDKAADVRCAVYQNCVIEEKNKSFFIWSTDGKGNYDIYDEPPGSLQLLPFYGFVDKEDETWRNTIQMIRDESYDLSFAGSPIAEIGCRHAPHPWILSFCNSLLCGYEKEAAKHLGLTKMDNGVACESVNERTGECETGAAFATCAGFLAYALYTAFGAENCD